MPWNRAGLALLVCIWIAVAGCDQRVTVDEACTTLCECKEFFPSERPACEANCQRDAEWEPYSQECLECIEAAECVDVRFGADFCDQECGLIY